MSIASIATGYALRKLTERTTWIGVIGYVSAKYHLTVDMTTQNRIVDVALAVMALVLILVTEHKAAPVSVSPPARADGAPADEVHPTDPVTHAAAEVIVRGPDGLTRHITPTGHTP